MALSGGSQGGEFTSAFGGVAEVHGRTASAASEAYDPQRSSALKFCCGAQRDTPLPDVVRCDPRIERAHETARVHTLAWQCGGPLADGSPGTAADGAPRRVHEHPVA
jgi:hypothetical protein